MEQRLLGRSGLRVSALCLGGNTFGWTTDERASFEVLDTFAELGGNFIDTADTYSRWVPGNVGGESERILGAWMKSRGNRAKIVLATKVGNPMGPGPDDRGLSGKRIFAAVEASLKRLQTDYIDLYQSHVDDSEVPLEETLGAYRELIKQGKVRAIGASNFSAERLKACIDLCIERGWPRYESLQPVYNLVDRSVFEGSLEKLCLGEEIGVIGYYALASGFLSGKYRPGGDVPSSPRARGIQEKYMNDRGFAVLSAVDKVASEYGASPAQVSIAWLLAKKSVTSPIVSATSPAQLREIRGAAELRLSEASVALLDSAGA